MEYTYETAEKSSIELKTKLKNSPYLADLDSLQNRDTVVVAYKSDVPVGLLTSKMSGHTSLYISQIHVMEPHRRKGIATQLIKQIENVAKEKSLQSLCLIVDKKNSGAMALYEKEGFVREFLGTFYKDIN